MYYVKGFIVNNRTNERWTFQYNPESLSVGRRANYNELTSPGNPYPIIQYTNGSSNDISISVFVRNESSTDLTVSSTDTVRSFGIYLDKLLPERNPGSANFRTNYRPPTCYVYLGAMNLLSFNAVLTDYTVDTDYLTGSLVPISATYKLTFKEVI